MSLLTVRELPLALNELCVIALCFVLLKSLSMHTLLLSVNYSCLKAEAGEGVTNVAHPVFLSQSVLTAPSFTTNFIYGFAPFFLNNNMNLDEHGARNWHSHHTDGLRPSGGTQFQPHPGPHTGC